MDEMYKPAVCQSLRMALANYEKAVQVNKDLTEITKWRRKVLDLTAVLDHLEYKETHKEAK